MGANARKRKAAREAARGDVRHKRPLKTKTMRNLERLIPKIATKHQFEEMIAMAPPAHADAIRALIMRKMGLENYEALPCCGHAALSRVETQGRNIVHGPRCPEKNKQVVLTDSLDGQVGKIVTPGTVDSVLEREGKLVTL